jgi:hypothetical protein
MQSQMRRNTNANAITNARYKELTIKRGCILQLRLILNNKAHTGRPEQSPQI